MSLKAKIFARNVSNLSDARYLSGMGAEFIAIQINPELPGYLSSEKFKEIAGWISGPEFVLQATNLNAEQIKKSRTDYGVDTILISPDQLNTINESGENIILEIYASAFKLINLSDSICSRKVTIINADIADAEVHEIMTESEKIFDQIFLGNISGENVANTYLTNFPTIGFAVSGTPEIQVGLKEYDFREFLEYLDSE